MTRTPLAERSMPHYTVNEERFNSISHIVGGGLAVVFLIACLYISIKHNNAVGVLASIIYGLGTLMEYTMSSIYHGLKDSMAKRVMQVMDHCTIYIMIAGTYTPICLCAIMKINPVIAWVLMGVEWGLAALAIVFTAIDLKRYSILSMACNIILGWAIIAVPQIAIEALTYNGFLLILAGGILYTVGAILYGIGRKKSYMHCVFHVFILIASILHFLGIFLFVL